MQESQLSIISRERAERAVPPTDCSGRKFSRDEWEDLVRTILEGAEIQRDHDEAIKLGTTLDQRNKDFSDGRRFQQQEIIKRLEMLAIQKLQGFLCINIDNWHTFRDMKIE